MSKVVEPLSPVDDIDESSKNSPRRLSPTTIGILCGLTAAVGYSAANVALRSLAEEKGLSWQIWVTFMKSLPAAMVAWGLIAYRASKGLVAFPSTRLIFPLVGVGLVMQFGGNLCFQLSLAHIGLALTVPLCFSTLICTGAGLGRVWLGEPIKKQTLIAMFALMVAISLISVGIWMNAPEQNSLDEQSWGMTLLAILTACISGISYGSCGVVIRRLVKKLPISAALVMFSSTGAVVLGIISFSSFGIGYEAVFYVTSKEWFALWAAGWANAVAFFAVGGAMKKLEVVRVNLLNASQVAMCAIAGVWFFSEDLTVWLAVGTTLTIVGLVLMGLKKNKTV